MPAAAADASTQLLTELTRAVGSRHVLTTALRTERYRKGFRSGEGAALAVVLPGSLLEMWQVLKACVAADVIVIMQAANTGLTEGSTPSGDDYDRPVVIINTLRMDRIDLLDEGKQVLSLPGGTLYRLEDLLRPLGRQPHSVIGSSCIGASIIGGISNNSGGSLIQRGPAFTELALYAQVDANGVLSLVNELDINLGTTPEEILGRLDRGDYTPADVAASTRRASDGDYSERVRQIDEASPARFNADPRRLSGASGSAGKLAIFAVRLDTFPQDGKDQVFYIGTNTPSVLTDLRRHLLAESEQLPIAAEYMHRDAFDIARIYGKDTFVLINTFGTGVMPRFFTLKGRIDALLAKVPLLPSNLLDKVVQHASRLWPEIVPKRLMEYRDRYEHHLLLKVSAGSADAVKAYLTSLPTDQNGGADWFAATPEEGRKAFLLRFAAAGAAIRYAIMHENTVEDMVALDIALPRNARDWLEELPEPLARSCETKLYYGHFFCHVFHQDYLVRKGTDLKAFKADMLALLDGRGAEYPAEHNVGHVYAAKPEHQAFFKSTDPTNSFNAGIGKMSKHKHYGCDC
ncbi:lactate dehydrogenase [Devosia epidermidihirudinis]|uniref:Quinone-dependent D-lactate dehydrogenase n=1 Tax=Devosia epidermidihirudinis TaxID=1293439 RepID=A0A0F5Q4V6_9HYPH|nr:D-lactate dehydrogenase [Devosia epidermidihirudinis]KKC35942.1 lactate dehydrogenase [Devosia epidermidihirudinis]